MRPFCDIARGDMMVDAENPTIMNAKLAARADLLFLRVYPRGFRAFFAGNPKTRRRNIARGAFPSSSSSVFYMSVSLLILTAPGRGMYLSRRKKVVIPPRAVVIEIPYIAPHHV